MVDIDRVAALAQSLLTLRGADGKQDAWLWQHSERVMRLARMISLLPEFSDISVDRGAVAVAALFHDAGWVVQFNQGRMERWLVMNKPTTDLQRELAATFLREHASHLVPSPTLDTAAEAIRQCNFRETELPEAQILSEAENLDDVGMMHVVRQIRHHLAEGRSVEQLLNGWSRQKEYQYWEARIKDSFRIEAVRQLARTRLTTVDQVMSMIAREHSGMDVKRVIEAFGIETSPQEGVATP